MDKTVFRQVEKKWEPRNKQAALITRRASPLLLHTPPPEPPKREPTLKERLAAESKIRLARIAAIEAWQKQRLELRAKKRAEAKKLKPVPIIKHMWLDAIGKTFTGYKGGDFTMSDETRLWVANWGRCHDTSIIGLIDNGYEAIIETGFVQ